MRAHLVHNNQNSQKIQISLRFLILWSGSKHGRMYGYGRRPTYQMVFHINIHWSPKPCSYTILQQTSDNYCIHLIQITLGDRHISIYTCYEYAKVGCPRQRCNYNIYYIKNIEHFYNLNVQMSVKWTILIGHRSLTYQVENIFTSYYLFWWNNKNDNNILRVLNIIITNCCCHDDYY